MDPYATLNLSWCNSKKCESQVTFKFPIFYVKVLSGSHHVRDLQYKEFSISPEDLYSENLLGEKVASMLSNIDSFGPYINVTVDIIRGYIIGSNLGSHPHDLEINLHIYKEETFEDIDMEEEFGEMIDHILATIPQEGLQSEDFGGTRTSIFSILDLEILLYKEGEGDKKACSICLDDFNLGMKVKRMSCSHLFHESCIDLWLFKSNLCPLCRFAMPT